MFTRILAIADQEIRIGIRNKWLLLTTIIFTFFSLTLALLGTTPVGTLEVDRLTITVASLSTLSIYIVPLIAMLLAYDAVCGEIEKGTLQMTLACPIARVEFIFGKTLGHLSVLFIAIVIGYGVTLFYLAVTGAVSNTGLIDFIRLLFTSVLLGLCYLATGYVLSSLTRFQSTAAMYAVGTWLVLVIIFDLMLLGILVSFPDFVFVTELIPYGILLNPTDAFRLFNLTELGSSNLVGGLAGVSETLPFNHKLAAFSLVVFASVMLFVSTILIRKINP